MLLFPWAWLLRDVEVGCIDCLALCKDVTIIREDVSFDAVAEFTCLDVEVGSVDRVHIADVDGLSRRSPCRTFLFLS